MTNTSENKERIAYDLMILVLKAETAAGTARLDRDYYFKLYAECLKIVSTAPTK
jgi:hypothetical protein